MSRYYSYLNSAKQILQQYKGEEPFSSFIKKFFSLEKKYGSKDRKQIAHLCYCFFRLGRSLLKIPVEERILAGLFLCSTGSNEILGQLKPEWNKKTGATLKEKLLILNYSLLISDVFPWKDELSDEIDHEKFSESFFTQPNLFLRMRPGYENIVKTKLKKTAIEFNEISPTCLGLANAIKIENVIELDKEAVIQDLNSQETGEFMKSAILNLKSEIKVWDCCGGSGGKSLLAFDINSNVDLAVSDSRESIILNLRKRFAAAGIKNYKAFVADLTRNRESVTYKFDLIICDAPCTGSGTWSRTPEQLYFFDEKKIEQYSSLQKKIASNIIPQLKAGGFFLYITCSVFKKENEENIDFIRKEFHLELVKMELLKGYDKKADSLFVALFRKINS